MNKRNILGRFGALTLSMMTALTPLTAMAATDDIIDTNKKGSMSIYKYDMTAATEDGVDVTQFKADGKQHDDVEDKMERYLIEGVEFTYAKVADINTVTEGGQIEIRYDIPAELATALGLSGNTMYNSTEISEALKDALTNGSTDARNTLEDYMRGVGNRQTMTTDENGFASATNLPLGLYLVVETKVPANVQETVEPFFVSIPMTDVEGDSWFYDLTLYPKNQTDIPDIEKLVRQHDDAALYNKAEYLDTATGSEGDVMDYIFVSRIPKIDSKSTYFTQFTFTDLMDKGLSYNKDVEIYFYNTREEAEANDPSTAYMTWKHGSSEFSEVYEGANSEYNQMVVKPTEAGLAQMNAALEEKYMVVSYSATVNSDATVVLGDTGNTNEVTLRWKRTNMNYEDVLVDKARVYSFGINLNKIFTDSEQTPDPTKVQFVLQNKTDNHYLTAKQASAGVYYITDATKGATEDEGTKFSPAADGKLVIYGLEANNYVLTEIKTSEGYSLLKQPIVIDITCTDDSITATKTTLYDTVDKAANPNKTVIDHRIKDASATVDGSATAMSVHNARNNLQSNNGFVDISVTNTPSFKLPMTGGTGTIMFTVGGCALALGGVAMMTGKKSKKTDEE